MGGGTEPEFSGKIGKSTKLHQNVGIFSNFSILLKNIVLFSRFFRKFSSYSCNHGGILIEFAFSVPIVILLLYFVNDHYRFYELKNKARTSAYLAAGMVQQLGNKRTNKQLTKNDIARITYASCLNFFHNNSMFRPWPFGLYVVMDITYVKRITDDNYQYQFVWTATTAGTRPEEMNYYLGSLETKTKSEIAQLKSDLICERNGDERIRILYCYRNYGFSKKKLGLFILNPKINVVGTIWESELIITPKPGLFPVTK